MDRENVIKGLKSCIKMGRLGIENCRELNCPYFEDGFRPSCWLDVLADALSLLKEQESWINEIAEYQQSISGSGMHELDDYEKGKWDGLQIAWNIISEGR